MRKSWKVGSYLEKKWLLGKVINILPEEKIAVTDDFHQSDKILSL